MGYAAVEFAGLYGNDPAEVKALCQKIGLTPLSAHVAYLDLRDDLEKNMDCYAALGCQYIVVPYLLREYRPGTEAFYDVIRSLPRFAEAAKERGMILQYHNHAFEFVQLEDQYALDLLFETVGPQLLQTQLDTCWIKIAGEEPTEYLRKYADRIPTVHLKDFTFSDENTQTVMAEKYEFRPLGTGLQDLPAIIATALECGAQWFIVELDHPAMGHTALECAEISAEYLLNKIDV